MENTQNKIENIKPIINSTNMNKIINYLQNTEEWTYSDAVIGSEQYKNYLFLLIKYKNEELPPSYKIQKSWEAHILSDLDEFIELKKQLLDENSTRLNYKDYFKHGKFIAKNVHDVYEKTTKTLYLREFGETLPSISNIGLLGKYGSTLLGWIKTLLYYFFLAALTATFILLFLRFLKL